jgi:hypothetical protein
MDSFLALEERRSACEEGWKRSVVIEVVRFMSVFVGVGVVVVRAWDVE